MNEVEGFLEHYGVKGQKWGVRKQKRAERKAAKSTFYQNKANLILKEAMKDSEDKPRTLVSLNGRQVITGREFMTHMSNGGLMDIKTTEIFATRGASGPYQRQERIGVYRR